MCPSLFQEREHELMADKLQAVAGQLWYEAVAEKSLRQQLLQTRIGLPPRWLKMH